MRRETTYKPRDFSIDDAELNLEARWLIQFPDYITEMKNLKNINISRNYVEEIPDFVLNMTNLEVLKINGNKIREIPKDIKKLTNLKFLDLSKNKLTYLPEEIGDLENLEVLNLIGNKLDSLPSSIVNLPKLNHLKLSENNFSELPEDIGNLKNLTNIDLVENNLKEIPKSMKNLKKLARLHLRSNNLTQIPPFLWEIPDLNYLDLYGNQLSEEENVLIGKIPSFMLDYLRKKAPLGIGVLHIKSDLESYPITELSQYLYNQPEIKKVILLDDIINLSVDPSGETSNDIKLILEKLNVIIFIATSNSIKEIAKLKAILEIADKHAIPIIPLKSKEIDWTLMTNPKIAKELGREFETQDINKFSKDLYQYFWELKRTVNLMEPTARLKGIQNLYEQFYLSYRDIEQTFNQQIREYKIKIKSLEYRTP